MTLRLNFRREAEADIEEAFDWYESRSAGLGAEFLRAVDNTLAGIVRNPLAYQVVFRNTRRAVLHRFPYVVWFTVRPDDVVVVACVHGHRDPEHWRKRV
jgi:plasmid stabilization system protein ParE